VSNFIESSAISILLIPTSYRHIHYNKQRHYAMATAFSASVSFKGKTVQLDNITTSTTGEEVYEQVRQAHGLRDDDEVKLLYKGKKLQASAEVIFVTVPQKTPKIIAMATSSSTVTQVAGQKSDPLIRGFDQEKTRAPNQQQSFWGNNGQDKNYKFVRLEPCTRQMFGHTPSEKAPHSFEARRLLEKLATDPGIIVIMKDRELVVNTLGEMDPIDDRIMQKQQQSGHACLLGYNTNRGLRIDIKLRTEDLEDFRPYPELVSTLIHELSHNWVSEHDLLFWTNFAQMRAEYIYCHMYSKVLVKGKSTAELAGLSGINKQNVYLGIMQELVRDMQQHNLHPNMIEGPIQMRCRELDQTYAATKVKEQRLGGGENVGATTRERALDAAERRRKQQKE